MAGQRDLRLSFWQLALQGSSRAGGREVNHSGYWQGDAADTCSRTRCVRVRRQWVDVSQRFTITHYLWGNLKAALSAFILNMEIKKDQIEP